MERTLNQQRVDNNTREHANDNVIDVYVDRWGQRRGIGETMSEWEFVTIFDSLNKIRDITGIEYRLVGSEAESELGFFKISELEQWGVVEGAVGIATGREWDGTNKVYFEGLADPGYTQHVIFHEVAHIFGMPELRLPWFTNSSESIMGYDYEGFHGYTESDRAALQDYWA